MLLLNGHVLLLLVLQCALLLLGLLGLLLLVVVLLLLDLQLLHLQLLLLLLHLVLMEHLLLVQLGLTGGGRGLGDAGRDRHWCQRGAEDGSHWRTLRSGCVRIAGGSGRGVR